MTDTPLITGNFTVQAPAPAIATTPEQDAAAEQKLAKSREARRAARAAKVTGQTPQRPPVAQGSSDEAQDAAPKPASEQQEALRALEAERTELMARATKLGLPDHSGMAVRHLRRKIEDAEAAAEQASRPAEPIAMPDDGPYQAARQAYQHAAAYVHQLQAESAALPGRIEDAIKTGDFEALAAHRQRQSTLAAELELARLTAMDAHIESVKAEMPLVRAAAQIATAEALSAQEMIRIATADAFAAQATVDEAKARRSELSMTLGNLQRQRDELRASMVTGRRG